MKIRAHNVKTGPDAGKIEFRLGRVLTYLTPDEAREARNVLDIAWRTPPVESEREAQTAAVEDPLPGC